MASGLGARLLVSISAPVGGLTAGEFAILDWKAARSATRLVRKPLYAAEDASALETLVGARRRNVDVRRWRRRQRLHRPCVLGVLRGEQALATGGLSQRGCRADHRSTSLGPADQAAVVYTADNRKSQDFTNDRQVLRSAVERYIDTSIPGELRAAYAIGTVRRAVQGLMDIPHRRKALIFISSVGLGLTAGGDLGIGLMGGVGRARRQPTAIGCETSATWSGTRNAAT